MSKRIKGITVEIGGDTSKLEKALASVEKTSKKLSEELKTVNKALKFDPGNSELLAQKQQILAEAVEQTSKKLATLRDVQEQVERQFKSGAISDSEYRAFRQELILCEQELKDLTAQRDNIKRVGDTFVDVQEQVKKLKTQLSTAKNDLGNFGSTATAAVDKLARGVSAAVTTITAAGSALYAFERTAGAAADDINTLSKVTGVSTEELQKFSLASDLIDVSLEAYSNSYAKLTKNMTTATSGTGDAYDAFKALNVEIVNTEGTLRDNKAVFDEVISALSKMENETQRDAYALSIFGRSAMQLNPLIKGGVEALDEISASAEEFGIVLSQDALDGLNEFNDKADMMKATATGVSRVAATEFVACFDEIFAAADNFFDYIMEAKENGTLGEIAEDAAKGVEVFVSVLTTAIKFVVEYRKEIAAGATAFVAFKAAMEISKVIEAGVTAFRSLKTALDIAKAAQLGLNAAQAASPIGLIASAVTALIAGLVAYAAQLETAAKTINEMDKELANLKESNEENLESIEAECAMLRVKQQRYEKLREETARTAAEEKELADLAATLAAASGVNVESLRNEAGEYIELGNAIEKVIEKKKLEAQMNARTDIYEEEYKQLVEIQKQMTAIEDDFEDDGMLREEAEYDREYRKLKKKKEELEKGIADYDEWLNDYYKQIAEAEKSHEKEAYGTTSGYNTEYRKKYEEEQAAAAASLEEKIALYEEERKELDRLHKRQELSDAEYYDNLEKLLKEHGIAEKKETQELYDEIYIGRLNLNDKLTSAAEATATIEKKAAESLTESYEKTAESIISAKEQFADKLTSGLTLMSRDTDGEMIVTDIAAETEAMRQYVEAMTALKDSGASDGLMDKVLGMSQADATEFAEGILNSSGFDQYLAEYARFEEEAEKLSAMMYQTEADDFQQYFVGNVEKQLQELTAASYDEGVKSAEAYLEGMKSVGVSLASAGFDISNYKNAEGVSQSTAVQTDGKLLEAIHALAAQVEQMKNGNRTTVIELDGKTIAEVVTSEQRNDEYMTGG